MSYRRFTDSDGRTWEAWEVHPSVIERRMNADRRSEPRDSSERRISKEFRLVIPGELREGWLALQGNTERLRLSPIPDGWIHLSDEELSGLVDRAHLRPGIQR
jgi:hypothetical protein